MITTWNIQPGLRVMRTDQPVDRYGTVLKVGRKWLHVQMDSGRKQKFFIEGNEGFNPRVLSLRKAQ